jgi:hypothetical protein
VIETLTATTVALQELATALGSLPEAFSADWDAVAEMSSAAVWGSWLGVWNGGKICGAATKLLASRPEYAREAQVLIAMDHAEGALSATVLQAATAVLLRIPDVVAPLTRGLGPQLHARPQQPDAAADAAKADLATLLAICTDGSEHLRQCAQVCHKPQDRTAIDLKRHFFQSFVGLLTLFSECLDASSAEPAARSQPDGLRTRVAFRGIGGGTGEVTSRGACGCGGIGACSAEGVGAAFREGGFTSRFSRACAFFHAANPQQFKTLCV